MSGTVQSEPPKRPPKPAKVAEIVGPGEQLSRRYRATEFPPCECGSPNCPTATGKPETLRGAR